MHVENRRVTACCEGSERAIEEYAEENGKPISLKPSDASYSSVKGLESTEKSPSLATAPSFPLHTLSNA